MEHRYAENWENAKIDQKKEELKQKENHYKNIQSNMEMKSDQETRVHGEIESYTTNKVADLRNEIEFWMEQYDAESETRDMELGKLRVEIEMQKDNLEKVRNEYEFRTKFIEERLKIKEQRREAEAQARREAWATLIIQVSFFT